MSLFPWPVPEGLDQESPPTSVKIHFNIYSTQYYIRPMER